MLAAGLARRFGGNKLLANLSGRAIVSHVLDSVSTAQARGLLAGIYVVAAEGDDAVADLTRRAGATLVSNRDPSRGLSSSLKLGLTALPATLDAALVFLGDQPTIRGDVIERLIDAWLQGGSAVVRPRLPALPMFLDIQSSLPDPSGALPAVSKAMPGSVFHSRPARCPCGW